MAPKTYHKNVVCNGAATGSGTTTDRALRRCKSFSYDAMRRAITDRSDHSSVPTAFDVVHEGWRWSVRHRDPERAQTWMRDGYLDTVTFYVYSAASASTYDTVALRGAVIDEWKGNNAWGELGEWTIGGWCSVIQFNGTTLEGLTNRAAAPAVHLDYWDGDTVNRWDSGGI